jgi:hypothetical protein
MVCWYWFGAHPNHLTIVLALAAEMRAMPVTAVLKAFILFGGDRIGFVLRCVVLRKWMKSS